jgi:drug/metabolite transporter (DMT)-like permease
MEPTHVEPADWPRQATNRIVDLVDAARVQTTDRAVTAARAVVFGTVVALLAVVLVTLALIGSFRLLDGYLPFETWAAYLILGGVLTVVGFVLWSQRRPRDA